LTRHEKINPSVSITLIRNIDVCVAELASFTQAATRLGLPKAAISIAVKQLESELGTRLLHRTTRKVELTQDGKVFYERCKDMLADFDELQSMFKTDQQALTGRIRVDMPITVARDVVLPALPGFLASHPELEVELSSTDRQVDLVREGFDCVLRAGDVKAPNLMVMPIGHYPMTNCASAAYVEQFGLPQCLEDLATHRLIHYVSTLGSRDRGFEYIDPDAPDKVIFVKMPGALTVNNVEAYHAACLAGFGIIQVPRMGVCAELSRGQFVEVLPRFTAAPMPISIIYANRRHQPRRVRLFMSWLQQIMQATIES